MTEGKRFTGAIVPRTFGLMLDMPGRSNLFVSPIQYVLAQLAMEKPAEIVSRVADWAKRSDADYKESIESLVEGVVKKEGTRNVLNNSRRTATHRSNLVLRSVKHYGGTFDAEVKSRGGTRDNEGYQEVSLMEPPARRDVNIGYPDNTCSCQDHKYGRVKGKRLNVVCMHVAIPEIALDMDRRSGASKESNVTGLIPSKRQMRAPHPSLPFTFNFFKPDMNSREKELWQLTTDAIMNYYVQGQSQFDINESMLQNAHIFSSPLIGAIAHPEDRARFEVLRQKAEEVSKSDLTPEQDRRYAAVNTMVKNLHTYFMEKFGYFPAGYGREFVGTPWETTARRFERRGNSLVYSLVTSDENPPIVVQRHLGHKAQNWNESYDPVRTDHLADKLGIAYSLVDDVTRRDSIVKLMLPDEKMSKAGFHIPENLSAEYKALRARMGVKK